MNRNWFLSLLSLLITCSCLASVWAGGSPDPGKPGIYCAGNSRIKVGTFTLFAYFGLLFPSKEEIVKSDAIFWNIGLGGLFKLQ